MNKPHLLENLINYIGLSGQPASVIRKTWQHQVEPSMQELCKMIISSDGEYSSLMIAEKALKVYSTLSADEKIEFFSALCHHYDVDLDEIKQCVTDYERSADSDNYKKLTASVISKRREILRRLNLAPGGTSSLVSMRGDLLALKSTHPELMKLDVDFQHLFESWFNRGFLVLRSIDWKTPAHILEKIIAYEAVHEIPNWRALRKRLAPSDRHCFAFFHPMIEDEPLVFVQVALTQDIPDNISHILEIEEQTNPEHAKCAIFYSISNCHTGLRGVSFGNFLIKQVASELKQRFPNLHSSATLSPMPKFRDWLMQHEADNTESLDIIAEIESCLSSAQAHPHTDWIKHKAAKYLLNAKDHNGFPLDPVAKFHLRNGASLERINPLADYSQNGQKQSLGVMVNYFYNLSKVENNHEIYMLNGEITHSSQIKKLLSEKTKTH